MTRDDELKLLFEHILRLTKCADSVRGNRLYRRELRALRDFVKDLLHA